MDTYRRAVTPPKVDDVFSAGKIGYVSLIATHTPAAAVTECAVAMPTPYAQRSNLVPAFD